MGIALEAGPPVGGGSSSHQVQQNPLPVVWGGWNPTVCACKYIIHGYPTYTFLPCLLLCLHNLQGRKTPRNSPDSTWNSHQKSGKQMDVGKASPGAGINTLQVCRKGTCPSSNPSKRQRPHIIKLISSWAACPCKAGLEISWEQMRGKKGRSKSSLHGLPPSLEHGQRG